MKSTLIFLCLLIAGVLSQNVSLLPEYDDQVTKLRVFNIHRPLVLFCNVTPSYDTMELVWTKDGEDVRQVPSLNNRYEILAAEHKFVIDRTVEGDHGLYACELPSLNKSAIINVVGNVASRLPKDTPLIEGESLWIVCRVAGTSPKVTWILPNNTILTASSDRIILERENDIANSALYIAIVNMEDRGNYTCVAENAATLAGFEPSSATGIVRVRSKMAPVYPVIGILVECFVLFVILFTYEKFFHEKEDLDDEHDEYEEYLPKKTPVSRPEKYNRKDKTQPDDNYADLVAYLSNCLPAVPSSSSLPAIGDHKVKN